VARYKDGRLRTLEAGPALKPEDVEAVAARVRDEVAETREYVHRSIVFSIRRAAGFWRYEDRFQLLPAPPEAPDVPGVTPHPLVLEFKVRRSADGALSTMRWTNTETKLVLLLNALLRFGLTPAGFRSACDQRLLGGQGRPLNSGWSPGVGSVNRQPKNGDATALGSRTSSPAGRRPVVIQDTRAEKPADSSLVV
jgi:hypothetical protein